MSFNEWSFKHLHLYFLLNMYTPEHVLLVLKLEKSSRMPTRLHFWVLWGWRGWLGSVMCHAYLPLASKEINPCDPLLRSLVDSLFNARTCSVTALTESRHVILDNKIQKTHDARCSVRETGNFWSWSIIYRTTVASMPATIFHMKLFSVCFSIKIQMMYFIYIQMKWSGIVLC